MNNKTMVVNHRPCLSDLFFLLVRILRLVSFIIYRDLVFVVLLWNMKARNPGKYCSPSLGVFSLFYVVWFLCNWYTLFYQTFYLYDISIDYSSKSNKKPSNVYRLFTENSKLKALEAFLVKFEMPACTNTYFSIFSFG
jgi:hypothetical protein